MRDDLLALSSESLVVLANVGLVKRAQKEVESGAGPTIEEADDGTVVAHSKDGATTRIPRNTTLKGAACSCGAATVCRHRVAAVLAYQRQFARTEQPSGTEASWSPGAFTDEALREVCGDAAMTRAQAFLRKSYLVTTRPGTVPVASLPASTVQFLAPNALALAKCDCTKGGACEHVVLAVWAFRARPEGGVFELGTADHESGTAALAQVESALRAVMMRGLSDTGATTELTRARVHADQAGLVWIADGIEDLERQKDAYDRQSAFFDSRRCSLLVGELVARIRASRNSKLLPPRWVLGSDEARETLLEQVRLISLGARLDADNERRFATIYFAERDTKSVLALRASWSFTGADKPRNGFELAQMFASSRMSVAALAKGDIVTRAATRRANGEIDLAFARGMKSSVLPGGSAWDDLPEPILVRSLETHEQRTRGRPPSFLRPRQIGDGVHVLAIARVVEIGYDAAEQELVAIVEDQAGARCILRTKHRTVSPGAVDAARDALENGARFVSGELCRTRHGWEIQPLGIGTDRLVVPDVEKPRSAEALPPAMGAHNDDALGATLHAFEEFVDRAVQKGWPLFVPAAPALAARLDETGLDRLGERVASFGAGSEDGFFDLLVLRMLLHEASADE
ncbi:hypothetical protein AKJ09_11432 [Labilithrix luteola]|uniref:SWIM-type domain-containing protein n=1 Tax=Labilithrix luteola TaxID=1391654 RepID=A0A0K1QG80_9BACT|nr:SWIM zinc finger family protein [Labilithrix luteola]AKV04769.1 hypothetical protein AKJ09_11432 [Labilithrix luteola]